MAVRTETPPRSAPRRGARGAAPERRWGLSHILIMIVALVGVALLVYPSAASWLSALKHDTEVDGYVQTVDNLAGAETSALLAQARAYNENLPAGPLRDPYALGADGQQTAVGDGSDAYFKTLAVPGSDAMARVRIPSIGVDLPVYHGTSDETLARGIGHLFGSGLPVGGAGNHAVLTGHSGFVQSKLFDDLDKVALGDTVVVSVLNQDLYYRVDQILTVLPDETESLRQVPGHDYVSLVTCTPTGVNTHRLLVRAERVDAPETDRSRVTIANTTDPAGFPWWAIALVGIPTAVFFVIRPRPVAPRRNARRGGSGETR